MLTYTLGSIFGFFEPISLIFDHLLPIFSEIFHPKVLGARLSRHIYSALHGTLYTSNLSPGFLLLGPASGVMAMMVKQTSRAY